MQERNFEHWEVLVRDDRRVGVRYRARSSHALLTRLIINRGERPYRAESRVHLEPRTGSWEMAWFRDDTMPDMVLLRRRLQKLPVDSMPSFADHLVLLRAIENSAKEIRYLRLNETSAEAQVPVGSKPPSANAGIVRVGEEELLQVPCGPALKTQRFEAWADGMLVATHWVDEHSEVVCSNWGSALTSYQIPEVASGADWVSLNGLDSDTIDFLSRGFAGAL